MSVQIWLIPSKDSYSHYYYPDFYLPETDEYIEIKGWWSESDKEKMKLVEKYNPNINIKYLNSIKEIEEYMLYVV